MNGARVLRYSAPAMPYDPTYHWPWRVDRMRALVNAERPDVLQVSSPFVPALVGATLRVPVRAYVYHSDPIGCYLRPKLFQRLSPKRAERALEPAWAWMRFVCDSYDVTVTAGDWLTTLLKQHGCQNPRTVRFGIDHSDFGPDRASSTVRRELLGPVADDPRATLFVIAGRLAMDKRQAMVIRALGQVARTRPVALVVLGDGPEKDQLRREARRLHHATFMSFTRDRRHYAQILATADALVHGSACETYGFVLAETLASGTPIVVPDYGGALAMASPGCSRTYPAYGDEHDVARAVRDLLDDDPVEQSKAAVAAAAEHRPMRDHFTELFELYSGLLDANRDSHWRNSTTTSAPV